MSLVKSFFSKVLMFVAIDSFFEGPSFASELRMLLVPTRSADTLGLAGVRSLSFLFSIGDAPSLLGLDTGYFLSQSRAACVHLDMGSPILTLCLN